MLFFHWDLDYSLRVYCRGLQAGLLYDLLPLFLQDGVIWRFFHIMNDALFGMSPCV